MEGNPILKKVDKIKQLFDVDKIVEGDYHDLGRFDLESFETVFIIEALCYSNNKRLVAEQVHHLLKPNGYFIIFDGYKGEKSESADELSNLAMELTQKSMAVDRFEEYRAVVADVKQAGFDLEYEEDLTKNILPTLYRFEKLAKILFINKWTGKIIKKVVSEEFSRNAIAGYLMPDLVKLGLAKYYLSVFKK